MAKVKKVSAPKLGPRFEKALALANRLHRTQVRKQTAIPYVSHLLGVASIALEYGANEDEAIAALLHDAVEDQGGKPTLAKIRRLFGPKVARIVEQCTDADVVPKPPWRERKEAYIAHLAHVSKSTILVSASDKLHNVRAIRRDFDELGHNLWTRFNGGRDGTLWYYNALVGAFYASGVHEPLIEELSRTVIALEQAVKATLHNGKPAQFTTEQINRMMVRSMRKSASEDEKLPRVHPPDDGITDVLSEP